MSLELFHEVFVALMHFERRTEPFWRPHGNALFRDKTAALLQKLIDLQRPRTQLGLAEEQHLPGEEQALDSIIHDMGEYMKRKYRPGEFERVGNTKTHGLVKAEVSIRTDLPPELRQAYSASRARFLRGSASPARVRTAHRTSTTWAS